MKASAGPKGQFLSALKDEFFGHLDKKSNITVDRLILIKLFKRIHRQCRYTWVCYSFGRITLRKSEMQHTYPFDCPHFVDPDKVCQFWKIIIQVLWKIRVFWVSVRASGWECWGGGCYSFVWYTIFVYLLASLSYSKKNILAQWEISIRRTDNCRDIWVFRCFGKVLKEGNF